MAQLQDDRNEAESRRAKLYEIEQLLSPKGDPGTHYVRRLIQRLRRSDPMACLGKEVLEHPDQPIEDIAPLLTTLAQPSDRHWRQRTVAAWVLGRAPLRPDQSAAAIESLLATLENRQITRRKHFARRAFRAAMFTIGPLLLLGGAFALGQYYGNLDCKLDSWCEGPYWAVTGLCMLTSMILAWLCMLMPAYSFATDAADSTFVRTMAAWALGSLRSPSSVGALAEASSEQNRMLRSAAFDALTRVLPVLSYEHYGQLGAKTVPDLCRLLYRYRVKDWLSLPILEALHKIGDARAIPAVEHLRDKSRSIVVREAATRLLPVLYERRREENDPATLLRASDAQAATSPDVLLRAAQAVTQTDPQELLRSTTSEPFSEPTRPLAASTSAPEQKATLRHN